MSETPNAPRVVSAAVRLAEEAGARGATEVLRGLGLIREGQMAQDSKTQGTPAASAGEAAPAAITFTSDSLAAHTAAAVAAATAARDNSLLPSATRHDVAVLALGVAIGIGGTLGVQKLRGGGETPAE